MILIFAPLNSSIATLLKIKISKIGLRHVLSWPKLGLEPKFHESGTFGGFGKRGQSLSRIFNTGPYGDPPLKIKILKIGLRSDLSWAKVGLEPKYHEPGTFGGFGKREQTYRQTRFMFYKYRYIIEISKSLKNIRTYTY